MAKSPPGGSGRRGEALVLNGSTPPCRFSPSLRQGDGDSRLGAAIRDVLEEIDLTRSGSTMSGFRARSVFEGELEAAENRLRQSEAAYDDLVDRVISTISALAAVLPVTQLPFRVRIELEEICRVTGIPKPR